MAKIKPCPFCGSDEAVYVYRDEGEDYDGGYRVVCDFTIGGCGASSGCGETPKEAIAKWNRREGEAE